MSWTVAWTAQALKDREKLTRSPYAKKGRELIGIIREDPYQSPPPFEMLIGDLEGALSRRINIQHRLVYQVLDAAHAVKILRCWTHYDS